MGCNGSKVDPAGKVDLAPAPNPVQTDSRLPLTTREVFRLQKSWKGIKRKMEETGIEMFIRLFKSNTNVQKMFKQLVSLSSEEDMRVDETLAGHGSVVIATIDGLISHIDDVDRVISSCEQLRARHVGYTGFLATTFWYMEEPFLEAVRVSLDTAFSDQIEEIYRKTFRFILQNLTGTNEPTLSNGVTNVIRVS